MPIDKPEITDRLAWEGLVSGWTALSIWLALAAVTVWFAPAWPWLVAAFVLLSAFLAADSASMLNIILEFCADEDRPTYIGLSNTLMAPATALAPLLGGWLAAQLGFPPMFALAALFAGLGAALLIALVHEPRHGRHTHEPARVIAS